MAAAAAVDDRARRSGRGGGSDRPGGHAAAHRRVARVRARSALRRRHVGHRPSCPPPLGDDAELQAGRAGRARAVLRRPRRSTATHVRVLRQPRADGLAIFVARPLTEVDRALGTLRWALGLLALAGIALAVVLSRLATRTAIRPVVELTETAEHVATTRDLSRRIDAQGEDEVSRLATSFNTMLEALERSQRAQRQLVADASHELRTPLTSLRTNLEVLARGGPPDAGDRDRLRADLVAQLEELTRARRRPRRARPRRGARGARGGGRAARPAGRRRGRARAPARARASRSTTELEPALVQGVPARLDRAVANLLDNAAKWSPPGGVVEVRLRDGELTVRDRGPGIDPARARPGLRPLLPRRRRARAARLRPRAWRSCARWPRATAGRSPRRPPTAAARCCACGSRSSQQIPRFG